MQKLSILATLLAFAAIPAQGQELIFGANVGGRWDSNVFNVPNAQSDFSARVGPEVRLLETQGDLTYDFHYVPTYQAYSRFASLDDWDQLVNSTVKYQLGPTTSIQVQDIFDYAPVATNFLQQLTSPTGVPLGAQVVNAIGHYNVLINSGSIDLQHQWTELWQGEATVTSFYYDPKVQDGIPSNNTTGSGNVSYAITQRDWIGGGLTFTLQQFGSNRFQPSTTSYFYNASAIWNHDFSPTWSLKMQAGPTLVDEGVIPIPSTVVVSPFPIGTSAAGFPALFDLNSCSTTGLPNGRSVLNQCAGLPTLRLNENVQVLGTTIPIVTVLSPTATQLAQTAVPVQGVSQGSHTSVTYFANILMTKRWETVTANLGYSRSAGTSGVFSSSTEVDTVSGNLIWTASPVWTTSLSVIWSDQSSSSNNTVSRQGIILPFQYTATGPLAIPPSAQTPQIVGVLVQQQKSTINIYQWIIGLHSDYKITKRLSVFGNFFYLNQSSGQQGGQGLNLSNLNLNSTRIDLGFHYEFDPIH